MGMKVMQERSCASKRTEESDHKEVLTFTLRSDEEHVRALTKHAVNKYGLLVRTQCSPICTQ